ncbi:tape measure protein [Corynebacterium sp. ZY180755]
MAVDLGTAYISIVPTTKDMQGDITQALRGLDKVGAKAGSDLGTAMGKSAEKSFGGGSLADKLMGGLSKGLKAGAIGAGTAVAGAFGTALVKGFGRLQAIDQAEAKFRGLGKSAQEIESIMSDVTASVKGTAFSTADAADVAAMALAAGAKPGDELQRTLKLVGDSAAFAGRGFGELGPVFTEAMSMGKVTGETLAQMRDNSIPAIAALSDHLGVSTEEVQKMASQGKISFEDFATSMETYIGGQALASGDTFQGSLANMSAAMGRFGEKLLEPVFANAPAVFAAVGGAFDELGTKLEPVITQFAEWLAPRMQDFAENIIPQVVDGIMGFVDGLITMGEWVSNNSEWLGPLVAGIGSAVGALYLVENGTDMVSDAMEMGKGAVENFGKGLDVLTKHPVIAAIALITGALVYFFTQTETGRQLWARFTQFLGDAWSNTVAWVKTKIAEMVVKFVEWRANISNAIEVVKGVFEGFKNAAVNAASRVITGITQIPGRIREAFAGAGSWLVDAGANIIRGLANGVRSMAGAIADAVRAVVPDNLERFVPDLHFGGVIPAFARGGVLPRIPGISDSERDPILGLNGKGIPIARVEPGEFIVNREATKKHLPLLRAINGGRVNGKQGDLGLPRYAGGGVVSAKQFLDFARGMNVDGKKAPRSLEGAPYVWGGGLLGNWGDCSGAMSGLAAFAVGMALAGRKFATMNEGQVLSQMGFSRGTSSGKNAFEVGFFNGGNFGGHTSGTLYDANGKATHLEMGGGRGNGQIGGGAAGARHSQYTDRYFINLRGGQADDITAGDVISTSAKGVTVQGESGTTYQIDWGEANSLASAWDSQSQRDKKLAEWERLFGSFDQGGMLSGKGVFAKNTLSPERVLSPSQTAAFEKLPSALVKQARAIDGLTARLEWQKVGAEIGAGLAAKGAFGAAMLGDIAKGDSLRAYASSMSLADGVGLTDRVGKILGMEKIGATLNPIVEAWTGMEDAAIGQVDAADAVKQAEKNLADARAKGDAQAIESAETELSKATGVAKSAAAAVGQAQVAMALTVVETIIGLVDLLIGRISAVGEAQGKAWAGIEDAFASMGKLASTIADLRHDVNALSVDWAMSMIELSNAYRDLRIVQQDGIVAQLEGAVEVAELQAEFEAQRKADMRAAAAHYDDLSLAYDAFRWAMAGANQQAMDEMAAWSDESHRIYSELLAAQVGQKLLEKQALLDNLEATWKLAQASFNLNDVTADLGVAAQKLAVASGAAFGVSEGEATVGERYATLVAEMAELKADNAKFGTWINPTNWGKNGLMGQNNRRIEQIEAELARIESMDEFKSLDSSVKTQVDDLVSRAGWMGFFGAGDKVSQLVSNSALGDAARALDQMDFENQLIDIEATQAERQRDIQKGLAEVEYLRQSSPLEAQIKALESEQASYETMAKYWETSNEDVRAALLRLAEAQEQGAKVVQITGSTVSTDDLAVALEQLGIRVEKIENPKPDAAAVVAGRR